MNEIIRLLKIGRIILSIGGASYAGAVHIAKFVGRAIAGAGADGRNSTYVLQHAPAIQARG